MLSRTKISIISVFFNDRVMLEKTIKSVLSQTYPNIEHVIIDGGSTDESVEIIKKYEPKYAGRLKWVSEPDNGLYDAHNKGVLLSTGVFFTVLFDEYSTIHAVEKLMDAIEISGADGVHCGMYFVKNGINIRRWSGKPGNIRFGWTPAAPGLCLKREIYDKYGGYNPDYKAGADFEFIVRVLKDKTVKLTSIREPLIYYHAGGVSNSGAKGNLIGIKESYKALKDNGIPFAWFAVFCKCVIAFCAYMFASRKPVAPVENENITVLV